MKTKVFITVDTEFSIGGAFADPINNKPVGAQAVLCNIGEEAHGLGFSPRYIFEVRDQGDIFRRGVQHLLLWRSADAGICAAHTRGRT
jgi:hypothetical protein